LQGLKLRETGLKRIIEDSIAGFIKPDNIEMKVLYDIRNDTVWLDHKKIVSALINLEKNAAESMPCGGTLRITADDSNNEILITIKDTGTGIPPEHMQHLFSPFFTTKPPGEGTGLGLSETYGIMKIHSGSISIDSNSDSSKGPTGTKISIRLPRRLILSDLKSKIIIHEE
jgi:signal transduction histidine kinase